mmetsp:Transcript_2765/g.6307  ORF Transcript_2765/g.6307 Transcript_2765/m.6307 type:complete len:107 (+) Transcript_2765:72-392(+)
MTIVSSFYSSEISFYRSEEVTSCYIQSVVLLLLQSRVEKHFQADFLPASLRNARDSYVAVIVCYRWMKTTHCTIAISLSPMSPSKQEHQLKSFISVHVQPFSSAAL